MISKPLCRLTKRALQAGCRGRGASSLPTLEQDGQVRKGREGNCQAGNMGVGMLLGPRKVLDLGRPRKEGCKQKPGDVREPVLVWELRHHRRKMEGCEGRQWAGSGFPWPPWKCFLRGCFA